VKQVGVTTNVILAVSGAKERAWGGCQLEGLMDTCLANPLLTSPLARQSHMIIPATMETGKCSLEAKSEQ
jgi:hypothetical protein